MAAELDLSGVTPANITPFEPGGESIHEDDLRQHIDDLVAYDAVNGILCNGHAGEVAGLSQAEQIRVIEIIDDTTTSETPVISGVTAGSTSQAVERSKAASAAGADALLILPPHTTITNHQAAAIEFFSALAANVDIPLIVFQTPDWAGGNYAPETLRALVEIDNIIGVKNAVWDVDHYQNDIRAIRDASFDAQVMVANDEHMLPSLMLRSDGIFLELAAVITDHIINLYEAVEGSDVEKAREIYDTMEPFVAAMYEPPIQYSHVRLKVALEIQGKITHADPRKPTLPISDDEREQIKEAMQASNLDF